MVKLPSEVQVNPSGRVRNADYTSGYNQRQFLNIRSTWTTHSRGATPKDLKWLSKTAKDSYEKCLSLISLPCYRYRYHKRPDAKLSTSNLNLTQS